MYGPPCDCVTNTYIIYTLYVKQARGCGFESHSIDPQCLKYLFQPKFVSVYKVDSIALFISVLFFFYCILIKLDYLFFVENFVKGNFCRTNFSSKSNDIVGDLFFLYILMEGFFTFFHLKNNKDSRMEEIFHFICFTGVLRTKEPPRNTGLVGTFRKHRQIRPSPVRST